MVTIKLVIIGERERANLVVRTARFFYIIGERERANLVVRSSGIFCIIGERELVVGTARFYDRSYVVHTSSTRFFLSEKHFKFLHRIFLVYITRGSQPQFLRWIGLEKMPFVVDEKGKENVVPVRQERLSRQRLHYRERARQRLATETSEERKHD